MAIISVSKRRKRYGNSQFRYGTVYIVITFVTLALLNLYCAKHCQHSFYQSKRSELTLQAKTLAHALERLDPLTLESVKDTVNDRLKTDNIQLIVRDQTGQLIYGNGINGYENRLIADIPKALEGIDLFLWTYEDQTTYSEIIVPLYDDDMVIGCLYLMEVDHIQGALIVSLQWMILAITLLLELIVILFTFIFANTSSRRTRKLMDSMEILKKGDYSHRIDLPGSDELAYLSHEINELIDRLETSERKRRQFISDASHELKTPLASIKLLADSVLQNADLDPAITREFVSDIEDEAVRLIRMSEKMLNLARGEAEEERTQGPILMAPTIASVVKMLSLQAQANSITIFTDLHDDVVIKISEDDLYQIAFNLAENGIKYNVPGGFLRICIHREDSFGILIVEDSGTGIPEDALSHIYERFYRVDKARSRATGGSGLGLSIVRSMVDRNKGTIQVESTFGKGTRFTVKFPAQIPQGERR